MRRIEKTGDYKVVTGILVGVAGLEPAASCTRNMHATNCAIPRIDLNNYIGRNI